MSCHIKCQDEDGNRFPINIDATGQPICSCPLCSCTCKAVYKLDSVHDIKVATECEKFAGKPNTVTPNPSKKLKESSDFVKNLLVGHIEEASHPSNALNLFPIKSKLTHVQEYGYNTAATTMSSSKVFLPDFIDNFRSHTADQMNPGLATMITRDGKQENVRALQTGRKWSHRAENNNLDRQVMRNIASSSNVCLTDATKTVINVDDTLDTMPDSNNVDDSDIMAVYTTDFGSIVRPYARNISNDNSNDSVDIHLDSLASGLYNRVCEYCFLQDTEDENDEDGVAFKILYGHLTQNQCGSCYWTCKLMARSANVHLSDVCERLLTNLPYHRGCNSP